MCERAATPHAIHSGPARRIYCCHPMRRSNYEAEMQNSDENRPTAPPPPPPPDPPWCPEEGLNNVHSDTSLVKSGANATSPPLPINSPMTAEQRLDLLKGLFLCQITALFICGTAVFSTLLVSYDVDIPTLQSFGNYCLLAVFYTIPFLYKTPSPILRRTLNERWWKYLVLALFDVEGNYMMVKAYQFTSITSVQLLDSVTIPVVLVLSCVFLRYRYRWIHISGVVVAISGMGIMIYADASRGTSGVGHNGTLVVDSNRAANFVGTCNSTEPCAVNLRWVGDLLAVLGATCYGFSNVGQEYFVNSVGRDEFLAAIGFFGMLINGAQFATLEWRETLTIGQTAHARVVLLYVIGFNFCLFAIYSIVPKTLQLTSAAVFNISILTSDFYTFLFGVFLFLLPLDPIYFVAYFLVIVGIVIYSWKPVPSR